MGRNILGYSKIREMKKENKELRSQLAALKIEHDELEKEHSDRGQYLAEKEKEIGEMKVKITNIRSGWGDLICKGIKWGAILCQVTSRLQKIKSSFKSSTIAKIREEIEKLKDEISEIVSQDVLKFHSKDNELV